jgi:hypothetical protein
MTEGQIREIVQHLRNVEYRRVRSMGVTGDSTTIPRSVMQLAADVIEALAAPVDDAEYKPAENAYHNAEHDKELQSKLWGSLEAARLARLARIQ